MDLRDVTIDESAWYKSTRSPAADHCVEVAIVPDADGVGIRDSKDPEGGELRVTRAAFAAFVGGAKGGEFDLP